MPEGFRLYCPWEFEESRNERNKIKIINFGIHLHQFSTMGKKIIPPSDPERLARVMDEKARMMGVRVFQLSQQSHPQS